MVKVVAGQDVPERPLDQCLEQLPGVGQRRGAEEDVLDAEETHDTHRRARQVSGNHLCRGVCAFDNYFTGHLADAFIQSDS